jgi:hypothetical protein
MAAYQTHSQEKGNNKNAASASHIGEAFNNPYTFIPFPKQVNRFASTALTADESNESPEDKKRKTGVLDLEIKTLSPLLTCSPIPVSDKSEHKTYKALTIDNDVILPSTGIRGALRTLMTILSGGTLGYLDENLWLLPQARDARLGPDPKNPEVPDKPFLAKVVHPGSSTVPGIIELGETRLMPAVDLSRQINNNLDKKRPTTGNSPLVWRDGSNQTWEVKLSGRPINKKGKREGLFKSSGQTIELSESFWQDYRGRHRHSIHPELKPGDLVWLKPVRNDCERITCEADIQSIQWARWGRHGELLKKLIPEHLLPDSMRPDGGVDMVTDLFGQIPHKGIDAAGPFAARIRPGNLIFMDAAGKTCMETLAPLSAPHPGCMAFYRDQEDLDEIGPDSPLKGYKVYRNTRERGDSAPWKYSVQGVYGKNGALKAPQQKVNKTAELLNEGLTGKLRIAFRALGPDEMALLLAACSVDWKLGGGKPIGLGHCRVIHVTMIDEDGNRSYPMELPKVPGDNLILSKKDKIWVKSFQQRIDLYRASQVPVDRLRYPRAVTQNNNGTSRAGLVWFARHASPRKNGTGLETIWTGGKLKNTLKNSQIKAQALPRLSADDLSADLLYGYDMIDQGVVPKQNQRKIGCLELFDQSVHAATAEKAGENISQNRETRKQIRSQRSPSPNRSVSMELTKDNIGGIIADELQNKKVDAAMAKELLQKLSDLGIERKQSKKWKNKFSVLESISGRK